MNGTLSSPPRPVGRSDPHCILRAVAFVLCVCATISVAAQPKPAGPDLLVLTNDAQVSEYRLVEPHLGLIRRVELPLRLTRGETGYSLFATPHYLIANAKPVGIETVIFRWNEATGIIDPRPVTTLTDLASIPIAVNPRADILYECRGVSVSQGSQQR